MALLLLPGIAGGAGAGARRGFRAATLPERPAPAEGGERARPGQKWDRTSEPSPVAIPTPCPPAIRSTASPDVGRADGAPPPETCPERRNRWTARGFSH